MPTLTRNIKFPSQEHAFLLKELTARITLAETNQNSQHDRWKKAEENVLAYLPESELDAKRRTRRENQGKPVYTTIQIPYSYALLMAAHTYWTSVFFARSPIHQFAGTEGEDENQVMAVEALINYQVTAGMMTGPYYIWLYDAGKYGTGILGHYWDKEIIQYSTVVPSPEGGKIQQTIQAPGYCGNRVYNVSPFDFYPDPRVSVGEFQRGEFVIIDKRISWSEIVRRKAQGFYVNTDMITSATGTSDPTQDDRSQLERPISHQFLETGDGIKHPAIVRAYECHVELIPKEWKLGSSEYPEKWVFTVTKDKSLILGAQPLGLMHGKFPFDVLETEIEAYGAWNRGIPAIMEPIQNTMDWLINTHFFNVRASLNNLFVADPTKVVMKDFENSEPGGFIRLKPEAYGSDIRTFFHQLQIQDITQSHVNDLSVMQGIGERVIGINDQILGSLAGGGRKTATEVRTSTSFGVNRLKTTSEYMSATGFGPHAQKLLATSQQYYDATKKLRIVGSLAQEAGMKFLQVTPDSIQGMYDFVPIDGTLPVDRFAQANLWKELLVNMARVPQVMMQYDLGKIFGWVAVMSGLKNIHQFKVQVLPPGVGPQGNVIPMRPGQTPAAPGSDTRMTGLQPPALGGPPGAIQY